MASFNVTGGSSVALLGYSVVEIKGRFGSETEVTVPLPTGFVPMAIIGTGSFVKSKDESGYSVANFTPTAEISCNSTTGRYTVKLDAGTGAPANAVARVFIVGQN